MLSLTCALGESMVDPMKFYHNNVFGGIVLAQAMVKHNVKRLIFSSSAAIFGNPVEPNTAIAEAAPKAPINAYGQTKLALEEACSRSLLGSQLTLPVRAYRCSTGAMSPTASRPFRCATSTRQVHTSTAPSVSASTALFGFWMLTMGRAVRHDVSGLFSDLTQARRTSPSRT